MWLSAVAILIALLKVTSSLWIPFVVQGPANAFQEVGAGELVPIPGSNSSVRIPDIGYAKQINSKEDGAGWARLLAHGVEFSDDQLARFLVVAPQSAVGDDVLRELAGEDERAKSIREAIQQRKVTRFDWTLANGSRVATTLTADGLFIYELLKSAPLNVIELEWSDPAHLIVQQ